VPADESDVLAPHDERVDLPLTFLAALRTEFGRTFRPPYEVPVVVAVNGALMSSAWFFLPASLKDDIFSLHGSLVFAAVLASWMYSDVPATNVLGPDSVRVRRALDDPVLFRRLLAAKNVVLWVLITPICCLVALLIGVANHNLLSTVITVVWIGIVPFGALGLSNLVGIRFPYHPMPLRYRWDHRRPFRRMIVRWLTLAVTPYVVFPAIAALLMAPTLILWGLLTPTGLSKNLHVTDFGWGVAVACVLAVAGWWGGHHAGYRLARRRSAWLDDFLGDPARA
jgi:hypothetical protein